MAEVGFLGDTPEEVARYLIIREIDDLTRSGALKLDSVPEPEQR